MPVTKSPFRYPGGKTQLNKFVRNLLNVNNLNEATYIEAFAGGFGVGIDLLLDNSVAEVIINDYDKSIFSVWYSIIHHTDELINLIEKTPITIDSWFEQKKIHAEYNEFEKSVKNGFATLFLNRTNRSGIINAGPIGGYEQGGKYLLDCRFNKKKIIDKIISISNQKDRITLYQEDAVNFIDIIQRRYSKEKSFCFFDPPYYEQGKNLYTNFYKHNNHVELAQKITQLHDYYWIITYDKSPQIHSIYNEYNIDQFEYDLTYSAQTKKKATEFIFASKKTKLVSHDKVCLSNL